MNDNELEIYVHIPFCVRKCLYCDFLSFANCKEQIEPYVEAVLREIKEKAKSFRERKVTSVFVGGGTPTAVDTKNLLRIIDSIYENFDVACDVEFSIEANPGTVDFEKLDALKKHGVNRISFGLQSTDNEELKRIGRIHSFEDFLQGFKDARRAGFDNINVDLMGALPMQSKENYLKGLQKIIDLAPEHISSYSLILEEGTYLCEHEKEYQFPDEDEERAMYDEGEELLAWNGYEHYEISNYAKKGFCCKHNIGYWIRKNYLGLGLGASSLIGDTRFKNTIDLKKYISSETFDKEEVETLTRNDCMQEFMFLGLRLLEGVNDKAFKEAFGESIEEVYKEAISSSIEDGLLEKIDGDYGVYRLTKRGASLSNVCMARFLLD